MSHVLIAAGAIAADTVTITDAGTLHHLRRVLRMKVGDHLECFDGAGGSYAGPIIRSAPEALVMAIERRAQAAPSGARVWLAAALIKPERFEWLIEKAVELGVERITPLITSRTTVQTTVGQTRQARWQRIAAAAAAQCGRATVPPLDAPERFEQAVAKGRGAGLILLPTLRAKTSIAEALSSVALAPKEILVFIGPEGDFTPEEITFAQQHGARAVRLGRLTLRSETAAIALLAVVQHAAGAWAA